MTVGVGSRSGKTNTVNNIARIDAYGNYGCQSAHLFSHAEVCHKAFGFLAEACVGRKVENQRQPPTYRSGRQPKKPRRLGSTSSARKRLMLLNGVRGKSNTSLKSHKYNKMYFKDQGEVFDTEDPSVLVVPLLLLEDILGWAAEGNQVEYDILTITFGDSSRIASKVLRCARAECEAGEIDLARGLLEAFVKAVAGSLLDNHVFESFTKKELNTPSNESLIRWKALVERIKQGEQTTIEVPTTLEELPEVVHVAKSHG